MFCNNMYNGLGVSNNEILDGNTIYQVYTHNVCISYVESGQKIKKEVNTGVI